MRAILSLPLLLLSLAQAADARDWAAYTSENFTVYSDAREKEAIAALEDFETFRKATLAVMNFSDEPESERLIVVMIDDAGDFGRIKPAGPVGGFFYHSLSGPRMVVGPSGGASATQVVLFHEYVHYLMDRHSSLNYPRWYSEGLAVLLSSIEIDATAVLIGRPTSDYSLFVSSGVGSPVDQVIDVGYRGSAAGFYVTAWLLTHYLLLDSEKATTRRGQLVDYLRRYDDGDDPEAAFTASFGMSPVAMQFELDSYRRQRQWTGYSIPRPTYSGALTKRMLDPGEDRFLLATLALERAKNEAALRFFDDFEKTAADSPYYVRAVTGRALAHMHEENISAADALIEPLLAQEIDDPGVLADIAHYGLDRYLHDRDNTDGDGLTHLRRSIDYGERAVAMVGDDLSSLYHLGIAHDHDGQLQLAANALLTAYGVNPTHATLNLALVSVLVRGRQPEFASFLISRLYSASHSDTTRADLRQLQDEIASGAIDLSKFEPGGLVDTEDP